MGQCSSADAFKSKHSPNKEVVALSSFENVIQPLFIEICDYLTTNEKLFVLPRISKHINREFDVTTCCRGQLSVNLGKPTKRWSMSVAQKREVPMIRHAKHLSLQNRTAKVSQQAIDNTLYAVTSGSLHTLCISGCAFVQSQSMVLNVLNAAPASRLQKLHIQLDLGVPSKTFTDHFTQAWKQMKQCQHLKYLVFEVNDFQPFYPSCHELFVALPNSLEELVLSVDVPLQSSLLVFKNMLKSNEYLPLLNNFTITQQNSFVAVVDNDEIAAVIATTIMSQTNHIRPISYWRVGSGKSFDHIRSFPLKQLRLGNWNECAEQVLLKCPSEFWPDLNKLIIPSLVVSGTTHFTSLLQLLSLHNITELDLNMQMTQSIPVLTHTTLGHHPALRFLHLRLDAHLSSAVFYVNSLPNLEVLHIDCVHVSHMALADMLKAAPNCRHVILNDDEGDYSPLRDVSPTYMIVMTLHFCPSVAIIDVVTRHGTCRGEHVKDVICAFKEYPIDACHMQNLVRISLPLSDFCDAAFHLLIHHLKSAPMLQAFHVHARQFNSLMRTCILTSLPHLRNIPFVHTLLPAMPHKQFQRLLSTCAERLSIPFVSSSEARRLDRQRMTFDELMIMRETFMYANFMSTPANVPVFRQETNNFGLSGRQQFEAYVHNKLNKQQQMLLSKWDAGDYTTCTEREAQVVNSPVNHSKGIIGMFRTQPSPDTCLFVPKRSRSEEMKMFKIQQSHY